MSTNEKRALAETIQAQLAGLLTAHQTAKDNLDQNEMDRVEGEMRNLFQVQATRDFLHAALSEQRAAVLQRIQTRLAPSHTCAAACRGAAQETPEFRAEMNWEAQLAYGNATSAQHAKVICQRILEMEQDPA